MKVQYKSEDSGCLEDGIGNEYINSSIHEQFNEIIESSTNLLKKKRSPKKMITVVRSPEKLRNMNQSVLTKTSKLKRQKINEKRAHRKSFDNLKMPA
jgi:3-deoxy-D-manno-octulosonic-acid transferase